VTRLIDTHCHLGKLHGSVEDIVSGAAKVGVSPVVDIGLGLDDSALVAERAGRFSGEVFASVGIHPNELNEYRADPSGSMRRLAELASKPGVVGIGETGLDFYRDREGAEAQEASFRAHIAVAIKTGKTLVVHCRDAHQDVMRVLDDEDRPPAVVIHCFSGDADFARACAEREFFFSFAGNLTYKKNEDLREAARAVPGPLLLVETDAPYLAPHPFRGKDNSPAFVPITAGVLAEARGEPLESLAVQLVENSRRAFALP
jgi:TatD DNase family protein